MKLSEELEKQKKLLTEFSTYEEAIGIHESRINNLDDVQKKVDVFLNWFLTKLF